MYPGDGSTASAWYRKQTLAVDKWDETATDAVTSSGSGRLDQRTSRLLKPRIPAVMRAAASRVSHKSGAADTSSPGSFGTWANGERSSTRLLNCKGLPNSSSSTHAARAAQPTGAASRGSNPYRAAETPTSTQTAGSCTIAWASTRGTSRPTSLLLSPYARPAAMPAAPSKITGPRMAKVRWLEAHRTRETGQASTDSTRPLLSSPRSLSAAPIAYPAATSPRRLMIAAKYVSAMPEEP